MGKSQSKQPTSQTEDRNSFCFALVGSGGSGKSAFVNAVRGVDDEHKNAAGINIVETEQSPKEYIYPSHPHVSFCDMPGYGTPKYPDCQTYWRKLELGKFNTFLIFISSRVTAIDLNIIKKVKSLNSSYLLIRTKIDVECGMENNIPQCKEDEILSTIRDYIVKQTGQLSCAEDIFLISSKDPYKWDFFRLIETIMNMMPDPEIDTTSDFIEQYMADTSAYIRENGVSGINDFLKKTLKRSENTKIRFGITGCAGTGKSAFINAIRGLKDDNDGAAEVDVVETTREPAEYKHPNNEKITFVDLPGIGTPNYPNLETYCKRVGLEEYDTFLIFTATRFTQNDLDLAKKVKSIGKSFFLIRTKIDVDCMPIKGKSIDEAEILERIRNYYISHVEDLISSEKNIFLISNYDTDKWEFDRLIDAISDALPLLQRECLILSLTNVTRECLKRKAKILKAQAFLVAAASVGTAAIPIPVVGNAIDTLMIAGTVLIYYNRLGLNKTTPEEIKLLDKKYIEIIKRYNMKSSAEIASTVVLKALPLFFGVEEVSRFIPIIGAAIAGSVSFAVTLRYLSRTVDEMEEAAIAVWENAAKQSI